MKRDANSNLVRATFEELQNLGYSQLSTKKDKKGNYLPPQRGSLLCLTNSARDLWAELSDSDIKNSKINAEQWMILGK